MPDFNPEKIRTADFPFPPGTAVTGSTGTLSTVIDRDGWAFLACCLKCEAHGRASGFYPQQENGRLLVRGLEAADEKWQTACRACVRTSVDIDPCILPAGHRGDCRPFTN